MRLADSGQAYFQPYQVFGILNFSFQGAVSEKNQHLCHFNQSFAYILPRQDVLWLLQMIECRVRAETYPLHPWSLSFIRCYVREVATVEAEIRD